MSQPTDTSEPAVESVDDLELIDGIITALDTAIATIDADPEMEAAEQCAVVFVGLTRALLPLMKREREVMARERR